MKQRGGLNLSLDLGTASRLIESTQKSKMLRTARTRFMAFGIIHSTGAKVYSLHFGLKELLL
jgi:hypothetical protein